MTLHKEGRKLIIAETILLVLIASASILYLQKVWLQILIILPITIFYALNVYFFRVPSRNLPEDDKKVIAPADGKIVVVEKTTETEYLNEERIQVSIFMSPLNVHQNVYPVSGEVEYTKYHNGKYLVAWHPKSSTENERATVVVKTLSGQKILFRQIAGALARRICCYAKVGDGARKGKEFGFIKFGSRVDIFLPLDAKILCSVGDVCQNKITTIAELT